MKQAKQVFVITVAIGILSVVPGAAQHAGHQMPGQAQDQGPAPSSAAGVGCAQAQPQVLQAIDAASRRLESARQANSPSQMRLALDDVQGALGAIRSQLAPCWTPEPQRADPHAGHGMPSTSQTVPAKSAPAPSPAAMDHSTMGSMDHSAMGGMDHSKMEHDMAPSSPESSVDPVCKMHVDSKTAPTAEYKGTTYVFCSESDRQKFLAAPDKYLETRP